ncbi:GGDEF domain-containing protein [Zhongshania guokunii]|uniref:GGDEF domain-containing protein n=1 Tax=Zhongshania guokunii TaxID=641783 RepID=A0ABV3U991_9GAMM
MREAFNALSITHPGQNNAPVTFSCGITTKEHAEDLANTDVSHCFKEADIALYAAKSSGRNAILHYENLELD